MKLPNSLTEKPLLRVVRQLVEALLFEKLVDFNCNLDAMHQVSQFTFSLGQHQYACLGQLLSFGRVKLQSGSVVRVIGEGTSQSELPIDDWQGICQLIEQLDIHPEKLAKLRDELGQTIKLCEWNQASIKRSVRRQLSFADLESVMDEGHPYHPCFKARSGFSIADHQAYGPECQQQFQLHWLAVERSQLAQSLPSDENAFWLQELGQSGFSQLNQRFNELGLNTAEYGLLPIHPWQWRCLSERDLQPWLDDNSLVYLGEAGDSYSATQSIRTVLNRNDETKASIKLPMNLVNTSSLRDLEAHSVCTAPVLSDWLAQQVVQDDWLSQRLMVLKEYAGLLFQPSTPAMQTPQGQAQALAGQLGVIFRQSLQAQLTPDQQAIPFTALYAVETDGHAFIHPWLQQYGLQTWLEQLVSVVVLPILHLTIKQGIGLEAHGQNLMLILQDGWPVKLAARDFHESLEYRLDYLDQPQSVPNFAALNPAYQNAPEDKYYWMSSVEAVRELVMDTLYVFNLIELASVLQAHYGLAEAQFWQQVDCSITKHLAQFPELKDKFSQLGHHAPSLQTESLLRKKLFGDRQTEFHHSISNPFYQGVASDPVGASKSSLLSTNDNSRLLVVADDEALIQ